MKFADIFKKSFLEGYAGVDLSTTQIIVTLGIALIISIYIFYTYRVMTRRTFYSKNFNISLIAMCLLTTAVILTIQSSLVVSLGMVGALSIVRFRTAVKDPMDLIFLFWAIAVGIMCGAGISQIAVLVSLLVTVVLFVFDKIPVAKAPAILVINATCTTGIDAEIKKVIEKHCKYFTLKSRNISNDQLDLVYELRIKEGIELTNDLYALENVFSVSLLSHDGEVTF